MGLRGRFAAVALALALAAPMTPLLATPVLATSSAGYVTAAATRDAGPLPEYLGMVAAEEGSEFVDTSNWVNWPLPKYELDATSYNTALDPYLANLAAGITTTSATYWNQDGRNGLEAGPDRALANWAGGIPGTGNDDGVWQRLPDVIIGDNNGAADAGYVAQATLVGIYLGVPTYTTTGTTYAASYYADLIASTYAAATAADAAVTATGKTLRYGNAGAIATAYERYIYGTQGYVLIGGITNNVNYGAAYTAVTANYPASQVYYTNGMTGDIAAQYGVVMNSVDNAQNFGRILGYDEQEAQGVIDEGYAWWNGDGGTYGTPSYAYSIGHDFGFDNPFDPDGHAGDYTPNVYYASTVYGTLGYFSYYSYSPTHAYLEGTGPSGTDRLGSTVVFLNGHANYNCLLCGDNGDPPEYRCGVYYGADMTSPTTGYIYAGLASRDLSGVRLISFVGCYTASTYESLCTNAVAGGADAALGFTDEITSTSAEGRLWLRKLNDALAFGYTVDVAVVYADGCAPTSDLAAYRHIEGDGTVTIAPL